MSNYDIIHVSSRGKSLWYTQRPNLKFCERGGDTVKIIAKVVKWIFEKLKRKKPIELNIQSINSTIILTIHKD